mmetsp:Transcript_66034/g.157900  ORF Transcript_66034/g.157900 Transcript_66034/m.157900 type:complete len:1207 (-) Transcript_66034:131-3751(-)
MPRIVGGENDENRQVRANQPDQLDGADRSRFGYKQKKAGTNSAPKLPFPDSCGASRGQQLLTSARSAPAIVPREESPALEEIVGGDAHEAPPQLVPLLNRVLGDPDALLRVIRLKVSATQYQYKEKIAEQTEVIKQMKAALDNQYKSQIELRDIFVNVQRRIDHRLSFAQQAVLSEQRAREAAETNLVLRTNELETAKQQSASLREAAEASAEAEVALREQQEKVTAHIDSVTLELQDKKRELQLALEDIEKLHHQREELELALQASRESEEECAAERMRQVRESGELLQRQAADYQEHREQMHGVFQEQSLEIATVKAALEKITQELEETKADRDKISQAHTDLEGVRNSLAREIERARVELQDREMELQMKESELLSSSASSSKKSELLSDLQVQNVELQARLQKATEHTEELRQQVAQQMRQLSEEQVQRGASEVEVETLKAQLVEQENLRGASLKREAELKLSLNQVTKERDEERSKASDKDVELEEYRVNLAEREATLAANQRREQNSKELAAKREAIIEAMRAEHAEEDQTSKENIRDLETRLAECETGRAQEMRDHKALEQEHHKLREQCERLRIQYGQLSQQRDELEANSRDAEQRLGERLASAETTCRERTEQLRLEQDASASLRAELKDLRVVEAELRSCSTASAVEAAQLQSELTMLRQQAIDQKQALGKAEADNERLTEAVAEGQVSLRDCQESLVQARAKNSEVSNELASTQASLTAKCAQAESLLQDKAALEVECRSYREHLHSGNQQHMEAIQKLELEVHKLNDKVECSQKELGRREGSMREQASFIQGLQEQLTKADAARRDLHNALQELKGNIRVLCRVRPALDEMATQAVREGQEANKFTLTVGPENYSFAFDKVFLPDENQQEVFDEVSGVVQSALDGYKVCIFAYGQTGSGKTFTMQGTEEPSSWGLIPRSLRQIFEKAELMRRDGWTWSLQASFIEVYNETLRDLLGGSSGSSSAPPAHVIKHDEHWGAIVTNVTAVEVDSLPQIKTLMARAARQRVVGATDMNAQSSRSHSVFALYLRGNHRERNIELNGALHLVDLAGSERLDRSGSTGERLKETQNINKSLSSLADVFLAKAEGRSHVPFRNSKLTHLMEPCLSGHGKTIMVVNVGPETDSAYETLCSLRFASQVSQCDTGGKPKRSARAPSAPSAGAPSSTGWSQPSQINQPPGRPASAGLPSAMAARRRR